MNVKEIDSKWNEIKKSRANGSLLNGLKIIPFFFLLRTSIFKAMVWQIFIYLWWTFATFSLHWSHTNLVFYTSLIHLKLLWINFNWTFGVPLIHVSSQPLILSSIWQIFCSHLPHIQASPFCRLTQWQMTTWPPGIFNFPRIWWKQTVMQNTFE